MRFARPLFCMLVLAIAAPAAIAHHNWAAIYEVESDLEIEGVVSSVKWRNPHVTLMVTVDAGMATEKTWDIASNSVASLARMGVTADLLVPGSTVKVAGYSSRRADNGLFMNHLLLPDNREVIFLRGASPRWGGEFIGTSDVLHGKVVEDDISKRPESLFAVWTTIYGAKGSHQSFTRSDQIPWTERAQEIFALNKESGADPLINCTPKGMPAAAGAPYPIQLIDEGNTIIVKMEEYDAVREIHMSDVHDDRDKEASGLGYSTGRWVDDTLVITTTKLNYGQVAGTAPQGLGMQLIETFHLRADRNHLDYTQVIIDPEMREAPTVNQKWYQWRPGAKVNPYACSD